MGNGWLGRKGDSYTDFVLDAAVDERVFATFRRQPVYRSIVETLSAEQGAEFLSAIDDPLVRRLCLASAAADCVGGPTTFPYEGVALSPTTLRYGKVLCDLQRFFPKYPRMRRIVEIGVGYGGLARLVWEHHLLAETMLETYVGIDLAPVAMLARRYMDLCTSGNNVIFLASEDTAVEDWDLVISNYAFSELDRTLQESYLARVLENASAGYLTMNTGLWSGTAFGHACFTVEELLERLPNAVLAPDRPESATSNYILAFGDHALGAGTPLEEIRAGSSRLIAEREARRAERRSLRGLFRRATSGIAAVLAS